jgi:hypothetical protein
MVLLHGLHGLSNLAVSNHATRCPPYKACGILGHATLHLPLEIETMSIHLIMALAASFVAPASDASPVGVPLEFDIQAATLAQKAATAVFCKQRDLAYIAAVSRTIVTLAYHNKADLEERMSYTSEQLHAYAAGLMEGAGAATELANENVGFETICGHITNGVGWKVYLSLPDTLIGVMHLVPR